jgi:ornithine carbamoyltransferase
MHNAARVMRWTAGGLGLLAVGYATVAGTTWYRYGHIPSASPDERDPLLAATVPVINGLTDFSHPCQIMADVMTFEEKKGPIGGRTLAWTGDGNNVATSWIHAAQRFGFTLHLACPQALGPNPEVIAWAEERQGRIRQFEDPKAAVEGADAVMTDVWVSMGDQDGERRRGLLEPYRVDAALMAAAPAQSLFMHCLPAHRGEEVTAEVIDGPNSVVFDQAENRLHAQKGILAWCLG